MRFYLTLLLALATLPAPGLSQSSADGELSALQRSRAERMLGERLACLGCHRLGSRGGTIGPALDGLASRTDAAYVQRMIENPSSVIPGTLMPRQPMPRREAGRLTRYLMSLEANPVTPSASTQSPPALASGQAMDGPALYSRHCAACHGVSGDGNGWNAANLPLSPTAHSDAALMSLRADDTLYDGIASGGFVLDKSNLMPAFGELLRPDQIRALVAHIRTLCGCQGPPWAREAPTR